MGKATFAPVSRCQKEKKSAGPDVPVAMDIPFGGIGSPMMKSKTSLFAI
jgi:hypothetical protein